MSGKSLNRVELIGRLGKDVDLRYTQNGSAVANFSVATDSSWTDSTGEKQTNTEWHNLVAWGKLAEICHQFAKKGSQVYVSGRLQTRSWEDDNQQKHYKTEVVAGEFIVLGNGKSQSDDDGEFDPQNPDQFGDEEFPF